MCINWHFFHDWQPWGDLLEAVRVRDGSELFFQRRFCNRCKMMEQRRAG